MNADIDDALIALFEWDSGAEERLAGFGAEAFHRVMSLYRERPADFPERLVEVMSGMGREALDAWSHAIAVVAYANPGLYVDQLEAVETLDAVILGTIDDPRVVGILETALGHEDWLIRYHAVRSLGKRAEPEARELIGKGLADPEEMVRQAAVEELRRLPEPP